MSFRFSYQGAYEYFLDGGHFTSDEADQLAKIVERTYPDPDLMLQEFVKQGKIWKQERESNNEQSADQDKPNGDD